ncbi:drug/metabolite transporter (DMT)-like permease [Natronocella acetinitrilica]|uniref:Drug/metabolite transporter (DMT)-like permease n=1 Tax=Natronocella acetinitrilica TaxID=414046 RepID=A0AAE3G643_9GAMM|nr:hypothetical protein [Natronocella acetinitrilica]MCP1674577.1 drug/metabolite transporter (DMT)-like permease [Natronocella acetinitrilica]
MVSQHHGSVSRKLAALGGTALGAGFTYVAYPLMAEADKHAPAAIEGSIQASIPMPLLVLALSLFTVPFLIPLIWNAVRDPGSRSRLLLAVAGLVSLVLCTAYALMGLSAPGITPQNSTDLYYPMVAFGALPLALLLLRERAERKPLGALARGRQRQLRRRRSR